MLGWHILNLDYHCFDCHWQEANFDVILDWSALVDKDYEHY
jgi:hypothetical protein